MADQNILVRVGADISDLVTGLRTATSNISGFSKRTTEVMRGVGEIGKAMTGFGVGAAAGLGVAVKKAADFDTAMRKAGAIAGANKSQFDDMRQAALDLGANTSKSASEVANAMTDMAAKGFSANQVIAAMPGVISAAEASGEDLALTSDTVASALNGFGLKASDASHVADVLAMSANKTAAGVEDMQYAFKYAAPIAKTLGVSLEELSAATGILANAGIKGESAGVALRGGLTQLLNPSKQTAQLMDQLGVKVTDNNGKFVGLSGVVKNLQTSMRGMTQAQKVATLSQLVGTEASSAFLTLMQAGPSKIDGMTASLKNSAGASAETAAQMKAGIGGTFQNLQGAIETFVITIGTALIPAIQTVATWLTNLTNWFNGLPASVQTTIAVVAALAAVFALVAGPIMIIVGQIPALLTLLGLLAAAIGTTTGVLLSTVAIITGVIAAIVAIGVALVVAYNKVGWFRDMVNAAWAAIVASWNTAIAAVSGVTRQVISAVSAFIGSQLAQIRAFWSTNGSAIMGIVRSYFGAIKAYISGIMSVIRGVFQAVWPVLTSIVRVAWASIKAVVSSALSLILGVIRTTTAIMRGDWSGAWSAIKSTVRNIGHDIVSSFKGINLVSIGKNIISGLINGIKSMAGGVLSAAKNIASSAVNAVKSALKIHSPSRVMAQIGKYVGAGLVKGMTGSSKSVQSAATKLSGLVKDAMSNKKSTGGQRAALKSVQSYASKMDKKLLSIAKKRESVASKLKDAQKKLDDAIKTRTDYKNQVTGNAESYASVTNIKAYTAKGLQTQLANRLKAIKAFQANIAKMKKKGVSKDIIKQIVDAGVDQGGQQASLLANASAKTVKAINSTQKQINSAANSLGKQTSAMFYDSGVNAAKGLVKGLQSQSKSLEKQASKLANAMVATIKRKLKIHSPSRLMRDDVGKNVVAGAIVGIEQMRTAAVATASSMADWLVPETPSVSMAYSTPNVGGKATVAGVAAVPEQSGTNTAMDSRVVQLLERIAAQNPTFNIDGKAFAKVTYDHYSDVGGTKTNLSERWG